VGHDSSASRLVDLPRLRAELDEAVTELRENIWGSTAQTQGTGSVVYLDIEASLVEIHSENNQQTTAT
jgi:hypothetical protein